MMHCKGENGTRSKKVTNTTPTTAKLKKSQITLGEMSRIQPTQRITVKKLTIRGTTTNGGDHQLSGSPSMVGVFGSLIEVDVLTVWASASTVGVVLSGVVASGSLV